MFLMVAYMDKIDLVEVASSSMNSAMVAGGAASPLLHWTLLLDLHLCAT